MSLPRVRVINRGAGFHCPGIFCSGAAAGISACLRLRRYSHRIKVHTMHVTTTAPIPTPIPACTPAGSAEKDPSRSPPSCSSLSSWATGPARLVDAGRVDVSSEVDNVGETAGVVRVDAVGVSLEVMLKYEDDIRKLDMFPCMDASPSNIQRKNTLESSTSKS